MAEAHSARTQTNCARVYVVKPSERIFRVNGHPCRIWEGGEGPTVGYLAGLIGQPNWSPFLDRLAEKHRVVVPSLPGFFGSVGYEDLDSTHDWVIAALDLIEGSGLFGAPMIGCSVGATIAAEVAAVYPNAFDRLVLVAPLGHYEESFPVAQIWTTTDVERSALLASNKRSLDAILECPAGEDENEWPIKLVRANGAAARLLWPTCDIGLIKRLHRIKVPTLMVWGELDAIVSYRYADLLASRLSGPSEVKLIADAGHLVDVDQPDQLAEVILRFLTDTPELAGAGGGGREPSRN